MNGFAHDGTRARHGRHSATATSSERIDGPLDRLDATDAQRKRIAELAPELARLAARRDALSEQVVSALAAEDLTAARIEALKRQITEQGARLASRALDVVFEIAAELTPEQRAELIERWERR